MEMLDKVKQAEEQAKTAKADAKAKAARMLADGTDCGVREKVRKRERKACGGSLWYEAENR